MKKKKKTDQANVHGNESECTAIYCPAMEDQEPLFLEMMRLLLLVTLLIVFPCCLRVSNSWGIFFVIFTYYQNKKLNLKGIEIF